MLESILASGSPQKGWHVFLNYITERADVEGENLDNEWSDLRQGEDENVIEYLRRAETLI